MRSITELTDRERKYLMWRLVQEAMAHFDEADARKRAQRRGDRQRTSKTPAALDFELPDAAKHPLR